MDDNTVVETVCSHQHDEQPILLKFQNGSLGGIADFTLVESKKNKRKHAAVVAGEELYTGELEDSQQFDTYICLRNKSTNKVQVIPVQQALLSNNVYRELAKKEKEKVLPILTKEHAAKKLLKEFGGRKASRLVDNREKMMVNVEVVRQDLDETVQGGAQNEDGEDDDTLADVNTSNKEYLASIVPKFDQTATKISEVFDVEDVVPANLLQRLDEEAKVVYATPLDQLPIESEYLRGCLKAIQDKEITSKQDFLNIKLIIYMDALQSLIALRSRQMKRVELSRITEKIENDIRHRFEDPNVAKSCTRTNYSTEKALTHFIVLALLISDKHEVDVNVLSRTLRTTKERIKSYAHIVNARPKARSDVLTLRLPSTVPALAKARSFQRRK
ncbi:uncharacterized protein LOC117589710 [Drosophila guanche]|uniref:Blast:DNA-directed RNA polymerase I subunit rpa49 n=1 Tax=Drosophila guanche TaxID=7266 RepID=A0A3B0K410_DROGU|nr:uncharacterized protein LOC117589710 [Drosophila guanche]SPP88023.1 blast:DNA-directed RNA polymerase I subunit rpa49 [Drosophila guanche]